VSHRSRVALVLAAAVLVTGCRDDGAEEPAAASSTAAAVTTVPRFEGDPDSRFCQISREAAERPVLDPFAAGLPPEEVELRFRALSQRFRRFADVAPAPLEDDLALLVSSFDELARVLDAADHDFARLAEDDVDVSIFDDPALGAIADRLAAYQDQVCER
jgi:hypothetical protein